MASGDQREQRKSREKQKAKLMFDGKSGKSTVKEWGKVWVDGCGEEFRKKLHALEESKKKDNGPSQPKGRGDIAAKAMSLAGALGKSERLSKLKALERALEGARGGSEGDEVQMVKYYLARYYPRLAEETRKVFVEDVLECAICWEPHDVRLLFHFLRVFYEAKTAGFSLEEKK